MSQYIRVDVQVLKSDLNDLHESIAELKMTFGETSTDVDSLRTKWRGEAAEKFMSCFSQQTQIYNEMVRELELMQEKLVQSQRDYADAKDALRQLVDNFHV